MTVVEVGVHEGFGDERGRGERGFGEETVEGSGHRERGEERGGFDCRCQRERVGKEGEAVHLEEGFQGLRVLAFGGAAPNGEVPLPEVWARHFIEHLPCF